MTTPSLRRRLSWLVGLPAVVLWLAAGTWLVWRTAHETGEMFDRELQRTAASVLAVVDALPAGHVDAIATPSSPRRQRPEFVVRDASGRAVLEASTLSAPAVMPAGAPFQTREELGRSWRVYQRWDAAHRYWIQVAAPLHDREQLLRAHVQGLLIPLAALLLLLPAALGLGLTTGLAPLRRLSRAIAARPAQTPRLTSPAVPAELRQLTLALDTLVASLDHALQRERRFTADAAHELRHPLAVLRLELDLAGAESSHTARAPHLARARDGLDRMERLVTQLLTLARVESLQHLADAAQVDVVQLVRRVVGEAAERAVPRDIELAFQASATATVVGSAGLLEIAVRNLVDNAIAHGRHRGHVAATVTSAPDQVAISIDNDGPAMPAALATRLGERFLRGEHSGGSGLGLSIVHAIAALHGGHLACVEPPGGGTRFTLRLPRTVP